MENGAGCRLGRIGKIVVLLYPSTLVIFFYCALFPYGTPAWLEGN